MANEYVIAVGASRTAATWKNKAFTWESFVERIASPTVTPETMTEYAVMDAALRADKKDVGGYVAGSLKDGKRKALNVQWRSMVTLDLDNVDVNAEAALKTIAERCPYTYVVHPSHSHRPHAPRLRLIIPLDAPVSEEQYEPIARRLAADIDIDWFDVTTYQASRLMYWPSVPQDLAYGEVFSVHEGPLCQGASMLNRYTDWRNVAEWPTSGAEAALVEHQAKRQGDPLLKDNVVGEFCRTYRIEDVIESFLGDVYEPTDKADRYTYTNGSTLGGLVLYQDGLFAYDNHGTSPASGMLCNAFDLVRVHKFGELDSTCKSGTAVNKRPSYKAMIELAVRDDKVLATRSKEREERLQDVFTFEDAPADETPWEDSLSVDKNGLVASTIKNVYVIMTHDERFKGKLFADEFAGRDMVVDPMPWTTGSGQNGVARDWSDVDTDCLRMFLEEGYNLNSKDKIETGLNNAFAANRKHPVREYLNGLPEWDGVERLESLIIDYLGAEDTPYVRAVTKTHLVAAVARVMRPGVKYDTMITLSGPQGAYKSSFIRLLCGTQWFDDSLKDFKGKEPFEILQGHWMIEIGELSAYKKADKEEFKAFISKVSDTYRPAYGRRTVQQKRQCVFWGTTNDAQFLRDVTGDRRTWPIAVDEILRVKDVWTDLEEERDQIWAEAVKAYKDGWSLVLSPEMEKAAEEARKNFREEDPRHDAIVAFLDEEIPKDWNTYDLMSRIDWLDGIADRDGVETMRRNRVTALEVWAECLKGNVNSFSKRDAAEINLILANLEGWRKDNSEFRLSARCYGSKRKKLSYVRI